MSSRRPVLWLGGLYALLWIGLAIKPKYRADWALENALVVVFIATMAFVFRRFAFSRLSYTLIFLFLCLHEVGAHYTYSEVPYDAWTRALFGISLNELLDWRRENRSFEGMGALAGRDFTLSGREQPERIGAAAASAELFDLLGSKPALGRTFRRGYLAGP